MSDHGHVSVDTINLGEEVIDRGLIATPDVAEYALWLGDDALVLGQRLSWWISRGPELEEDLALANIALDQIGHARSFLSYAGTLDGRTEDDLAYFRGEGEFRSLHLMEQLNGDYAHTIVRGLLAAIYQQELYTALLGSADATLAAIAAKAVKETEYHLEHATEWVRRFAGGTEESLARVTRALEVMMPYWEEAFRDTDLIDRLGPIAARPSALLPAADERLDAILAEAGLERPRGLVAQGGGRHGKHSEHLAFMLAEMQVLARSHPGASW